MRLTAIKRRKRARTHGFLKRRASSGGRATLARRRRKGRWQIAVKVRRT
ncbi:MAG: 50S ribosomal protein L34 [Candidatus Terrybacteria bacterium]|nr:50S ribosomal protein L34 [Candidatus Terrybacteria bacterium]